MQCYKELKKKMLFGYSDDEAHLILLLVPRNENFHGNPHNLAVLSNNHQLIFVTEAA